MEYYNPRWTQRLQNSLYLPMGSAIQPLHALVLINSKSWAHRDFLVLLRCLLQPSYDKNLHRITALILLLVALNHYIVILRVPYVFLLAIFEILDSRDPLQDLLGQFQLPPG